MPSEPATAARERRDRDRFCPHCDIDLGLHGTYEYPKGYARCSYCFGYGLVTGYNGEPTDCGHCGMSGIERKRDEKGRYAS